MTLARIMSLVSAFVLVLCSGCSLGNKDVVGVYSIHTKQGTQALAVEVRPDGTFTMYQSVNGQDTGSGKWRLHSHPYFGEKGLEFDGGNGSESYADEFRITRQFGQLCIEVRPNEEYWCKSKG